MSIFLMLLQFFPYVLQSVIAVEQAIGSAPGATKKQLVLNSISAVAGVSTTVPNAKVAAIGGLIDNVVSGLNAAGILGSIVPTIPTVAAPAAAVTTAV